MLDNIQIGSNLYTANYINLYHPFSRILFILIVSSMIGISDNIVVLSFISILLFILILLSKASIKMYFKGLYSIKLLLILTFFTTYFFHHNLSYTGIMILKFVLLVLLGSIFLHTTKLKDMVEGIRILISPLHILRINCDEIAFILLLTIRFIPIVIEEAKKMIKSLICRGLDYYGSIVNRIKTIPIIFYPIIIKTIYTTSDFSNALLMRSIEVKNSKKAKIDNWHIRDTVITLFSLVMLIYIIRNEVLK